MADTENETQPDEESPFVAPDGADDPDEQTPLEGDLPDAPEPEPEPEPVEGGMSEKEIDAAHKKLERAATNYRNRVSEIMAEDANAMVECPACAHFVLGMIFPMEFSDEQKVKLWPYMGLPDPATVPMAKWAAPCEDCDGWGVVRTPSRVATQGEKNCRACGGFGFLDTDPGGGRVNGGAPSLAVAYEAPAAPAADDDPAIQTLKDLGYTVIPPFQVGAAT